jgi:hypothetical protein
VLVVIAVERMYSLCRPFSVCARVRAPHGAQAPHFTATYVPGLLGAAYIIALAMSAPQYYFWSLYTPPCAVDAWTQCLDIFTIVIRDTVDNATSNAAISSQHIYMLYSTIVMFWAPAVVIVVCASQSLVVDYIPLQICYAIIVYKLYARVFAATSASRGRQSNDVDDPFVLPDVAVDQPSPPLMPNEKHTVSNVEHCTVNTGGVEGDKDSVVGGRHCRDITFGRMQVVTNRAHAYFSRVRSDNQMCRRATSVSLRNGHFGLHHCLSDSRQNNRLLRLLSEYQYPSPNQPDRTGQPRSARSANTSITNNSLRMVNGELCMRRRTSRAVRITLVLLLLYILGWTPYNASTLWSVYAYESYQRWEDFAYATNCLVVVTAVINPLVYGHFETRSLLSSCTRLNA